MDTGCSQSLVSRAVCRHWERRGVDVLTADGKTLRCIGVGGISLRVGRVTPVTMEALVVDGRVLGCDLLLGIDAITKLGGVKISGAGEVQFLAEEAPQCAAIEIQEPDFSATFNQNTKTWTASWKWANGQTPAQLQNRVHEYPVAERVRAEYEAELRLWRENGWLVPYPETELGPPKGLIPMMAVVQHNKHKVRPVLDYRELNKYVDTYTAQADVCAQKLREWRQQGSDVAILDLRKAYLQVHVHKSLWPFQTVMLQGRRYCLTRMGFGLNVAPMIMRSIVNNVLSRSAQIHKATSSYIDDIFVNEDVATSARVKEHLATFGLACKAPEPLKTGTKVLGLEVRSEAGKLHWKRGSDVPEMPPVLTRRKVFSVCGKLVGHFPVCGWLRVATAFIKRHANTVTAGWDDETHDPQLRSMLLDTMARVHQNDPVRGEWCVDAKELNVWVDASSLATGVVLTTDGSAVEDACWLRPAGDTQHINLAELDAVLRGVNLALQWQAKVLHVKTDSACVHRWISDTLTGRARLTTKAASEMLIRRRLNTLADLVSEYKLSIDVTLVRSNDNRADRLTRVPQRWITDGRKETEPVQRVCGAATTTMSPQEIAQVHRQSGHPGIRRTLYFSRRLDPTVSKAAVRMAVKQCEACQSIDPAPVQWEKGALDVRSNWTRLGMDITHYGGEHFLTLIDCGPSKFAVWRRMRRQDSASVIRQLESVFFERGPPVEILTDNDTAFTCNAFRRFLDSWGVRLRFRCAYVPAGNGVAERSHRTIKTIAARQQCSVPEAVYWYNVTPKDSISPCTAPTNALHNYSVRIKGIDGTLPPEPLSTRKRDYQVGDVVWVRNPHSRCTTKSKLGRVTGICSPQTVAIDGTPRHVKDLRPVRGSCVPSSESDDDDESVESERMIGLGPPMTQDSPDTTGVRTREQTPHDDGSGDSSSSNTDAVPLRRSTRQKRPARSCTLCDHEARGECSEHASENRRAKRQRVCLCIFRKVQDPDR